MTHFKIVGIKRSVAHWSWPILVGALNRESNAPVEVERAQQRKNSCPRVLQLLAVLAGVVCGMLGNLSVEVAVAAQGNDEVSTSPSAQRQQAEPAQQQDEAAPGKNPPPHPFRNRVPVPEFPQGASWLNTQGPLRMADLRGKFVVLDFWTYCCINCIHVLPELKKLEHAFPNELVVIGVHTAKFETEKDSHNISEAILRYEIEHPVINDPDHRLWNTFGVRSWPTLVLIDPRGEFVGQQAGEIRAEQLEPILRNALPYYRHYRLLDEAPVRFDLLAYQQSPTPLRFPGKVLADEASDRLFISDSGQNRVIITRLDGTLVDIIGNGRIGREDGNYQQATFHHPQGVAIKDNFLYVADTENHLLRKVDLTTRTVTTLAGTGRQAQGAWSEAFDRDSSDGARLRWFGVPRDTALNSPWALWVYENDVYIAMAGPHQIWMFDEDENKIGPYAGNGREDIVDGPRLPEEPYAEGVSSFAQPSGLVADDTWLYVADSEGSSIRAVPWDSREKVQTVVGSVNLPRGRLFAFGDLESRNREQTLPRKLTANGQLPEGCLQHPLGVALREDQLYVADTYNNKIKVIDLRRGGCRTLVGTGQPGNSDVEGTFNEPAGLSYASNRLFIADTNNHAIRVVQLDDNFRVETLVIEGLTPAVSKSKAIDPRAKFKDADEITAAAVRLRPEQGHVQLVIDLKLDEGWKINPLAPMAYLLETADDTGPVDRDNLMKLVHLENPTAQLKVNVPVLKTGTDELAVSVVYYYCQQGGEGLCRMRSVVWRVPLEVSGDAKQSSAVLRQSKKSDRAVSD